MINFRANCIGFFTNSICIFQTFILCTNLDWICKTYKFCKIVYVIQLVSFDIGQFFHEINPIFEEICYQS